MKGYWLDDIKQGIEVPKLVLSPEYSVVHVTPIPGGQGKQMVTRAFRADLHLPETQEKWFSETCIVVPPSGLRFQFPVPLNRFNFYVAADRFDNNRHCFALAWDVNGNPAQGDTGHTPFGPMGADHIPPGVDPKTRDAQYMVTSRLGDNPVTPEYDPGPPLRYVDFYPDGEDVVLGLCQPVTSVGPIGDKP
jgi:hypothetical protein